MTAKMFGYTNPLGLNSNLLAPYAGTVHLCATNSLRKGIDTYYRGDVIKGALVGAGMLLRQFLDDWSLTRTKLLQFAQLSERLEMLTVGEEDEARLKQLRAFRRNQAQVLETMRTLAEINMDVSRVKAAVQSDDERFFVELWLWMEHNGYLFPHIRHRLGTELRDATKMQDALRTALEKCEDVDAKQIPDRIHQIILHGFYFITPLQHRFFKLMQEAGIELVFLNLYDERFKESFRPVRTFIEGWVPYEKWEHIPSDQHAEPTAGEWFANLYESDIPYPVPHWDQPLQLEAHADFHSLLREYGQQPNGRDGVVEYYSPDHEPLNDRIKEYYPDFFEERHFLAYPIGQFLLHLHKMWNEVKRDLILDERSLFECFASGWLQVGTCNGRQYLHDLRDLLPYFRGCQTHEEWTELMDELQELRTNRLEVQRQLPTANPESRRFHNMMGDPLLRFSFLSVSEESLHVVILLIRRLWEIAQDLFGQGNARISLSEHFGKIETMLTECIKGNALLQEEQAALNRLRNELTAPRDDEEKYLVQDLAVAISLYLKGVFEESGDAERMIRSFEDLDAIPFLRGKRIHICGLSEETLPRSSSELPWPLTRPLLESFIDTPEIRMMLYRDQFAPEFARYLFYHVLAFAQEPVTLSWIRDWAGKELEESVYVKVLGLPVIDKGGRQELQPITTEAPIEREVALSIEDLSAYPTDALFEYELCPRRFYHSYLAQPFANYRDDFHHQFLICALFMTAEELTDREEEEAFDQIHKLFPLWTELKMKDIQLRAVELRDQVIEAGSDAYEGIRYPRLRKQFQFLKPMHLSGREILSTLTKDEHLQLNAKPSSECKYCPHLPLCKDGLYAIDEK